VIKGDQMQTGGVAATLKLADFQAQAEAIVQQARQQAQRIVAEARAEADGIFKEAERRGRAEGFSRGREETGAQGQDDGRGESAGNSVAEIVEAAALTREIIAELSAARAELLECAEQEMLRFALEIAEKIVGRVAGADVSAARVNLQKALELCTAGRITVRVNPRQLKLLRRHCAELSKTLAGAGPIELAADEQIAPGGVKVVAGGGAIDATIQTQWANIVEALLGSQDASGEAGPCLSETGNCESHEADREQGMAAEWLRAAGRSQAGAMTRESELGARRKRKEATLRHESL
jgi:flagellar biosynthesis/type III secretory pathway protein FliH